MLGARWSCDGFGPINSSQQYLMTSRVMEPRLGFSVARGWVIGTGTFTVKADYLLHLGASFFGSNETPVG